MADRRRFRHGLRLSAGAAPRTAGPGWHGVRGSYSRSPRQAIVSGPVACRRARPGALHRRRGIGLPPDLAGREAVARDARRLPHAATDVHAPPRPGRCGPGPPRSTPPEGGAPLDPAQPSGGSSSLTGTRAPAVLPRLPPGPWQGAGTRPRARAGVAELDPLRGAVGVPWRVCRPRRGSAASDPPEEAPGRAQDRQIAQKSQHARLRLRRGPGRNRGRGQGFRSRRGPADDGRQRRSAPSPGSGRAASPRSRPRCPHPLPQGRLVRGSPSGASAPGLPPDPRRPAVPRPSPTRGCARPVATPSLPAGRQDRRAAAGNDDDGHRLAPHLPQPLLPPLGRPLTRSLLRDCPPGLRAAQHHRRAGMARPRPRRSWTKRPRARHRLSHLNVNRKILHKTAIGDNHCCYCR